VITDPARIVWPARVTLLECQTCREAIVVRQFRAAVETMWMGPYRIWPDPKRPPFEPIPTQTAT
jgi:hypothetical protein